MTQINHISVLMMPQNIQYVLTQEHKTSIDGKAVNHHLITYVIGILKGSQLNWAALTKEAYDIYMCACQLRNH